MNKLLDKAERLDAEAKALREKAREERLSELLKKPIDERLVYAATVRCECGAGMAYDPASHGSGPFKGPSKWECGDILRHPALAPAEQEKVEQAIHTGGLPFAFYEIKSENQPSAYGASTRPAQQ